MDMRVLSFNLRTSTALDGRHCWSKRADSVVTEIEYIGAAVMGLQEVTHKMLVNLREALPSYAFLGVARDDGLEAGEYSPVAYRVDRFDLIDDGHFWLSDQPDVVGSWGWDAACIRIATWAILEDKQSKTRFFFLNTHVDHEGVLAREESSLLIRTEAERLAGDLPIVITGDFNAADDALSIRLLTAHPTDYEELAAGHEERLGKLEALRVQLHDCQAISERAYHGPDFSFHDFKLPAVLQDRSRYPFAERIDYIFLRSGVRCLRLVLSTNMAGDRCISDHLPVTADLVI